MRIYIRHGEKQYGNGESESLRHDPDLTDEGKVVASKTGLRLVQMYGHPDYVICSPYLRTRSTATALISLLEVSIPIYIDVKLSEYLGNHPNEPLDVTEETLSYTPPHPEKFYQLQQRVAAHQKINFHLDKSSEIVWYVSHGLIINTLYKCLPLKVPKKTNPIPYLGMLKIKHHHGKLNAQFINLLDNNH